MMSKSYTYTFIIPHKNCPDLLQRCINSIPERDDVQIIVVDDNSDEDKKPTVNRKGVEVILLDFEHAKGAGRARNVGLSHANGKWLLFADADDYYSMTVLTQLLDKYKDDTHTDLVFLNANVFDENGKMHPFQINTLIKKYKEGCKETETELRYRVWTPWTRMVKKNMIIANNLHFDEIPACNDKMFCLGCSKYANTIIAEEEIVYYYYKPQKGSITDNQRNYMMLDALLDVRGRTIELYKEVNCLPLPSFFELIFFTNFTKGLSFRKVYGKYKDALNNYNQSMIKDLLLFLRNKLTN
jgi:glycosyltransferase involved in cell wall biosynthesis